MRAGGRGVVGCSIIWTIYYYCQFEKVGDDSPLSPLENTLQSSFHQNFEEPKAIIQGFFFGVRKNVLRKVILLKVNEKRN